MKKLKLIQNDFTHLPEALKLLFLNILSDANNLDSCINLCEIIFYNNQKLKDEILDFN